jgi:aryl-alcohol dehydrogenase-like predicted oxidoreductase
MGLDRLPTDLPADEVALRFAAHCPGVDVAIAGTASLDHFRHNLAIVEKGPLPEDLVGAIRKAFLAHGGAWEGLI